jgi:hypothetical protein
VTAQTSRITGSLFDLTRSERPGITEYMNSGGAIEIAQQIAGHESSSTTRIYDRSRDRLTIEEIERVQIGEKKIAAS